MENENNFAGGFKNIAKWVGYFLVFLVIVVWVLLWARWSANYAWVMRVREFYLDKIIEKRYLPDRLPYAIQPKQKADEGYWYEMWGRLMSVDYASYTMTIADKRGVEWRAYFPIVPDKTVGNLAKIVLNQNTYWADGKVTNKIVYIDIDTSAPGATLHVLSDNLASAGRVAPT